MEAGFGFGVGSALALFVIIVTCASLHGCPQYPPHRPACDGIKTISHSASIFLPLSPFERAEDSRLPAVPLSWR